MSDDPTKRFDENLCTIVQTCLPEGVTTYLVIVLDAPFRLAV
jgi:hypothetical protein